MQFDTRRQRITAPVGVGISHYHLLLGSDGTAMHHAHLTAMCLAQHEHPTIQVSVPLGPPVVSTGFHSSVGREGAKRLLPGECYVVPPLQPHSFAADSSVELINLYLSPGFLDAGVRDFFLDASRHVRDLTVRHDQVLRQHALFLRQNLKSTGSCEQIQVESAAIAVADHLAKHYCDDLRQPARYGAGVLRLPVLARVLTHIEDRCTQDLSIGELAAISGYSCVHFRRLFSNSTGCGPLAYIYQRRIQRAQALLRRTALPVQEIGIRTGFSTPSHFIAQFRKKTGTTPQAYRREFWNGKRSPLPLSHPINVGAGFIH